MINENEISDSEIEKQQILAISISDQGEDVGAYRQDQASPRDF